MLNARNKFINKYAVDAVMLYRVFTELVFINVHFVLRYLNVLRNPAQAVNIVFSFIYLWSGAKYKNITLKLEEFFVLVFICAVSLSLWKTY